MSGYHQHISREIYEHTGKSMNKNINMDIDVSMCDYCCRGISNRTARSSAIAIKRNRNSTRNDDDIADTANYEMFTWRMYLRIVSYRMTRQGSDGSSLSSQGTTEFIDLDHFYHHDDGAQGASPSHLNFPYDFPHTVSMTTLEIQAHELRIPDNKDDDIFQLDL